MTVVYKPGATGVGDTAVTYNSDGSVQIERAVVEVNVTGGVDVGVCAEIPPEGLLIGTGSACGLKLKDPSVSRKHVAIHPVADGVRVEDLQSTNGTVYAGKKITEVEVPLGAKIKLGKTILEVTRRVSVEPLPLSRRRRFGDLQGSSSAMRRVYSLLERAAEADVTVLLDGETGTGKELAARALHNHSMRASQNFQIVDCGAVSPTLIEAELFGHVRGSFTGADRDRAGAFELAHGGTLFFDEVGELPLALQPKLLRALESREVRRIGGGSRVLVDVRFVAATNRDLAKEVRAGRFREDLYYRLNVFRVTMPPLRDHLDDIPLLVKHFLSPHDVPSLTDDVLERMSQLRWAGNIRELKNAVERAVVMAGGGKARRSTVPPSTPKSVEGTGSMPAIEVDVSRPFKELKSKVVSVFERTYLDQILAKSGGNISAAARAAGIDRKHMERLIRKHEIDVKSY